MFIYIYVCIFICVYSNSVYIFIYIYIYIYRLLPVPFGCLGGVRAAVFFSLPVDEKLPDGVKPGDQLLGPVSYGEPAFPAAGIDQHNTNCKDHVLFMI